MPRLCCRWLPINTILLNDDVESDTKMSIMRQLILQSEQTTKDSTQIVSLFRQILERPQQNADLAMLCAQYLITKNMEKESVPVLNQVLALDPENKPARLQLLSYAIRDNDLDEVIRVALPALQYIFTAVKNCLTRLMPLTIRPWSTIRTISEP